MRWAAWLDAFFPYIEALTAEEKKKKSKQLQNDISAINAAKFSSEPERALDEAQRVAAAEVERARTAESKATTYLAVLAALVPLVITLQAATWEDKSGPAPEAIKIVVLFIAIIYVAAAGYHAFKTLQVSGFHRVMESDVAAAWRTPSPLQRLTNSTLLSSRMSRDAVNAKVTRIKATHQHLVRAFAAFVLLLSLDPIFYAAGAIGNNFEIWTPMNSEQVRELSDSGPRALSTSEPPDEDPAESVQSSESEGMRQIVSPPETAQPVEKNGVE